MPNRSGVSDHSLTIENGTWTPLRMQMTEIAAYVLKIAQDDISISCKFLRKTEKYDRGQS